MAADRILYAVDPLGCFGAPAQNDGRAEHRILKILEWIPHLKRLGITDVLFHPVFESGSHGYDIRAFAQTDCRLGTNEDFAEVCRSLHENGIGVLLDAVFNHVGRDFPPFQNVRQKKQNSPYRDWFFLNFNDTWAPDGFTYGNWEGDNTFVKLNLKNPEVISVLFSAAEFWIREFQIDGIRLANACCMDREFLSALADHLHAIRPDLFLLGEMNGGDCRLLIEECHLDCVTNREGRDRLCSSLNYEDLSDIGWLLNDPSGFRKEALSACSFLLNYVDSHDTSRIAGVLKNPCDLPLAYDLLYAMPGIPCIYCGSEWGMKGMRTKDSDSAVRPEIAAPEWNSLCDHIALLSALRRSFPVFSRGDYRPVSVSGDLLAFTRTLPDETLLFVLNRSDQETVFTPEGTWPVMEDLCTKEKTDPSCGIRLKPKSSVFLHHYA